MSNRDFVAWQRRERRRALMWAALGWVVVIFVAAVTLALAWFLVSWLVPAACGVVTS